MLICMKQKIKQHNYIYSELAIIIKTKKLKSIIAINDIR